MFSNGALPLPPLDCAHRVGSLREVADPWALYDETGRAIRDDLLAALPDGYSLAGRRVLDFGCGAGRSLRHFLDEGPDAELWGCDIDEPSIDWLREHLSPPLHVFANGELPPLDRPDESFDVIFAVSVFSHLARSWSAWLLELHRVLKPGGLLLATFMGEGWSREFTGDEWDEDRTGMLTLCPGQAWDDGGPMIVHSPWWIREHWGRAFEVVSLAPDGFPCKPAGEGQGMAVLRKRDDVRLSAPELESPSGDPRELAALTYNVELLARELEELRPAVKWLGGERERATRELARAEADGTAAAEQLRETSAALLDANQRLAMLPLIESRAEAAREESVWLVGERARLEERIAGLQARVDLIEGSRSWRLAAPLRRLRQALRR